MSPARIQGRSMATGNNHPARRARRIQSLLSREEVRYVLVAGASSLWFLAVYAVQVAMGIPYMIALLASHVLAIAVAFPLYRAVVFGSGGTIRGDLVRFAGVWIGSAVIGAALLPALVEGAGVAPIPAQILSVGTLALVSFLGHRHLTFRPR